MGKYKNYRNYIGLIKNYLFASLVFNVVYSIYLYSTHENFFSFGIIPVFMMVANYFVYFEGKKDLLSGWSHYFYPIFLFVQTLSYIVVAWGANNPSLIWTSFAPICFGAIHFTYMEYSNRKNHTKLKEEQFFYHDLINHTHGLNLFLNNKINKNVGVDVSECHMLQKELKTLQSLMQDYYGHRHKNLCTSYEMVSFNFAKQSTLNLVENFLPANYVNVHYTFKGPLGNLQSEHIFKEAYIHFPTYHRILTNLIKNVSEAGSSEVEFIFDMDDKFLKIMIKNKICYLKDNKSNMAEKLGNLIKLPANHDPQQGVGIDSTQLLLEKIGGHAHFAVEGDYWVSSLEIPYESEQGQVSNTAA